MKKIIIGLLTLNLIVLCSLVWIVASDEYDENLSFYLDEQLYNIMFDERFDEQIDLTANFVEEMYLELNEEEHVCLVENHEDEYNYIHRELLLLIEDLKNIQLEDEDIIQIHNVLIEACESILIGLESSYDGYEKTNFDKYDNGIDSLLLSEELIEEWQNLIIDKELEALETE